MCRVLSNSPGSDGDDPDVGASTERITTAAPATPCGAEDDVADNTPGRYKLWELDPGAYCSIIGTCLSLDDLRRISRKANVSIAPDAQDYDIHGYFVTHVGKRSPLAKLTQKTLDRHYAPQVARFHRAHTQEQREELWREAMTSGAVAGSYWALMTHKSVPRKMRVQAHNEIHMLSHLMGKSSRLEIKRLSQLESHCAELNERLAETRARTDKLLQARDARIHALEEQLAQIHVANVRPTVGRLQVVGKEKASLEWLQARVATMGRRLRVERARARAAESQLSAIVEARATLAHPASARSSEAPENEEIACAIESHRRYALLYVGGYRDVMPRLRDHVEERGSAFLYHDGGIEMQTLRLPGLVSRADAVFCPIGCISHDACLRLKHLCKRHRKMFIPLRSAGLSGFVAALDAFIKLPNGTAVVLADNAWKSDKKEAPR
jgi:hypothetical protein